MARLVAAGTMTAIAAILYLSHDSSRTCTMVFAVVIGVFVPIMLGGGLMTPSAATISTQPVWRRRLNGATPKLLF